MYKLRTLTPEPPKEEGLTEKYRKIIRVFVYKWELGAEENLYFNKNPKN